MKKNRSGDLLFCIVTEKDVYFVDVKEHPENSEFISYSMLYEIYKNGWIEHIGFEKVPNYLPRRVFQVIKNDEDLYKCYDSGSNVGFDFDDNLYYPAFGIVSTKDTTFNVMKINRFFKQIKRIYEDYKMYEYTYEILPNPDMLIIFTFSGSKTLIKLFVSMDLEMKLVDV